jgi:hypothetical protein
MLSKEALNRAIEEVNTFRDKYDVPDAFESINKEDVYEVLGAIDEVIHAVDGFSGAKLEKGETTPFELIAVITGNYLVGALRSLSMRLSKWDGKKDTAVWDILVQYFLGEINAAFRGFVEAAKHI